MLKKILAVLGGGFKAFAIAAKAEILKRRGYDAPQVVIIEKNIVGANWAGSHGYTSGGHQLGTSPIKDLGFPYHHNWSDDVVADMNRDFSWIAYMQSKSCPWMSYGDWVDRGTPSPPHHIWQKYLMWVSEKCMSSETTRLIKGEVNKIDIINGRWQISYSSGKENMEIDADGLVISGPGDTKPIASQPVHERIFNGVDFWQHRDKFIGLDHDTAGDPICVIGGGETAAAVITELLELQDKKLPPAIAIINGNGIIFSRGERYQENSIYTDADNRNWPDLSRDQRRVIISRTDRGVFSLSSLSVIDLATNIIMESGRVIKIEIDGQTDTPILFISDGQGRVREIPASYVIVATGFDPWSFTKMLAPPYERLLTGSGNITRERILWSVRRDLSINWEQVSADLKNGALPNLHVPMLSALAQGPGFPNLSCLGTLSDRILTSYINYF